MARVYLFYELTGLQFDKQLREEIIALLTQGQPGIDLPIIKEVHSHLTLDDEKRLSIKTTKSALVSAIFFSLPGWFILIGGLSQMLALTDPVFFRNLPLSPSASLIRMFLSALIFYAAAFAAGMIYFQPLRHWIQAKRVKSLLAKQCNTKIEDDSEVKLKSLRDVSKLTQACQE